MVTWCVVDIDIPSSMLYYFKNIKEYIMTKQEILTKLKDILSKQFGKDESEITENKHLVDDLGADSLDIIEIVMSAEHEFGIKIEEDEYEYCDTVKLMIELVEKKLQDK
jgi:acyl carrier protein